jgi:hypothetical protein
MTPLPARDGVVPAIRAEGSAPTVLFHPLADDDGRIKWDVEVATAGEYEATVYYPARRRRGLQIELSCGTATIRAEVTEASIRRSGRPGPRAAPRRILHENFGHSSWHIPSRARPQRVGPPRSRSPRQPGYGHARRSPDFDE